MTHAGDEALRDPKDATPFIAKYAAWMMRRQDAAGVVAMAVCAYLFATVPAVVVDLWAIEHRQRTGVPLAPLDDWAFRVLPRYAGGARLNDLAEITFICAAAFAIARRGRLRAAARESFVLQSILWALRAPALVLTLLPGPLGETCEADPGLSRATVFTTAARVLAGRARTCNDCMFSGCVLCAFRRRRCQPNQPTPVRPQS